jgi:putative oxidoreductase
MMLLVLRIIILYYKGVYEMKRYPYISLIQALTILRIAVAVFFMAHAVVRIANDTIAQFGLFFESIGFIYGILLVWLISIYELIGGLLMAVGRYVRVMATGLFVIAFVGILLIHRQNGWFVGEHGVGGMEYSFSLMVSLIVIVAADAKSNKTALNEKR